MPKVKFNLDEQFSDLRSSEIAYKFTIENEGQSAIELLSITPRIPEDVELVQVKEASFVAVRAKYSELCAELTELLKDHLYLSSEEMQQKVLTLQKKQIDEIVKDISGWYGILRFYASMFKGTYIRRLEQYKRQSSAFSFKIEKLQDAQWAFDEWLDNASESSKTTKELFKAKMEQLKQLEAESGLDIKSASLATIEPASFFSMSYILRFPRYMFSPRKFNIAIECSYSELDKKYLGGATTPIIISPRPITISILAIIFSLMGVVLKISIEAANQDKDLRQVLQSALIGRPGISAVILAIIFFNIYEYTDLGKKFTMGVGWRSALLIGALCGLLGDRILVAIKAFVGIP